MFLSNRFVPFFVGFVQNLEEKKSPPPEYNPVQAPHKDRYHWGPLAPVSDPLIAFPGGNIQNEPKSFLIK